MQRCWRRTSQARTPAPPAPAPQQPVLPRPAWPSSYPPQRHMWPRCWPRCAWGARQPSGPALQGAAERSPELCAALLGPATQVMVARDSVPLSLPFRRAAFLPLDPRWPPKRLALVLEEARPAALLWADPSVPGGHGKPPLAAADSCGGSSSGGTGRGSAGPAVLQLTAAHLAGSGAGSGGEALPAGPGWVALAAPGPSAPPPLPYCYVLYTSGSTGAPLGVCGTEEGAPLQARRQPQPGRH